MKLVRATNESLRKRVKIKELGRLAKEGEEFKVEDDRIPTLTGDNRFHAAFVVVVKDLEAEGVKPETVDIPSVEEKVDDTEPEIFVINPGEDPVKVDENLQPIETPSEEKPKKRRSRKKDKVEE